MTTNNQQVWAFQAPGGKDNDAKDLLYESLKSGKSRFGWSIYDENNLKGSEPHEWNSRQRFLLEVKEGDWIVHINLPNWGECVAARVVKPYAFDEGLSCSWRHETETPDFRHCLEIDKESIIKFDRRDLRIIPTVNLRPRYRYHRVYEVDDFIQSIDYLKENKDLKQDEEYHLKNRIQEEKFLVNISNIIHKMKPDKNLESFLGKVFEKVPGVKHVKRNGYGKDHGADLIVDMRTELGHQHRVIVQVKSYEGPHRDLKAVEQVEEGIKHFGGTEGMVITTGDRTQELEEKVQEVSESIDIPIDLLDATELAKFVIKHAPELLFHFN